MKLEQTEKLLEYLKDVKKKNFRVDIDGESFNNILKSVEASKHEFEHHHKIYAVRDQNKNTPLWKRLKGYLLWKTPEYSGSNTDLDDTPLWNIYDPSVSNRNLFKKFNFFQVALKYRLVVPFLLLIEKYLKKLKMKGVPDYHYNKNFQIFDKCYEKALQDWLEFYIRRNSSKDIKKEEYKRGGAVRMLRTMKNLVIAGGLYDTAYREFFNMLMFHIGMEMQKTYKGKTVHHLLYPSRTAYDTNYWVISKQLQGKIELENLTKLKKDKLKKEQQKTSAPVKDGTVSSNKPNKPRANKKNKPKV